MTLFKLFYKGSSTNLSRLKQWTFSAKAERGLKPFPLKMTSRIRKNIAIKVY